MPGHVSETRRHWYRKLSEEEREALPKPVFRPSAREEDRRNVESLLFSGMSLSAIARTAGTNIDSIKAVRRGEGDLSENQSFLLHIKAMTATSPLQDARNRGKGGRRG